MNKISIYCASLLLILGFTACENAHSTKSDGMAQFVNDTAFQEAHESPTEITVDGQGQMMKFPTPDNNKGNAYMIAPENGEYQQALIVVHEWWGLNDHIKQEAQHLFDSLGQKVMVLAIDMYDGQVTDKPDMAGKIMESVKAERANAIVQGALQYVRPEAKIATIGWCFGGGWSLKTAIAASNRANACVLYYGMPVTEAKELAPLTCPVFGIFAEKDQWINAPVVKSFQDLAKATGKKVEANWYPADHAFANPSSPRYNEKQAQLANAKALDFLRSQMK